VLVPLLKGGWRAYFPDFPGCRAEGLRLELAIEKATREVTSLVAELQHQGMSVPNARSYEQVRDDAAWATERGIDLPKAVISLVKLGGW
jgi:hypothetical protein